jgi:nucleotide-binding universal stress UspA family protein
VRVQGAVPGDAGGEAAEVHIVVPAPHTSRLQRLTGAVDEARAEAEDVAREAAEAVKGTASVETEVGDPNPLQAIEDALRAFPADELIIVTRPGSEADWVDEGKTQETLERLGLPVTYLAIDRP